MKSAKNKFFLIALCGALLVGLLSAADSFFELSKSIDLYASVYKEVNNYYVDDVEPSKLMRTSIDGMLKTLDPFTNYFSTSQIENAKMQQGGKFGGLGIDIELVNNLPVVIAVWQNQPADKAGVKVGDIIKSIDGASTKDKKKEDVERFLIGQPKSTVQLQLERKVSLLDTKLVQLQLTREEIQETNVPFFGMVNNEVGCIKLKIFNENAAKDVKSAFDSLKRAQPAMKGIILDLRGNPGGLLIEAVNLMNIFIEKNQLVVTTKGKVSEWNNTFNTQNEPTDLKMPIVVITNSMSASASEIVSGSFQDYDRGVVIGQRTYGKGLVQVTKPLSYNTMLKVTTAKYYIPSGRCIQALNYSEKNEDGSVKRIPDSLKVAFKTKNGRPVWDGGGVEPDVEMEKPTQSKLAATLISKNYILDFATQYTLQHPIIAEAGAFKLTAKDYEDFVVYVKRKDHSYKTETDDKLEALKTVSTEEKYYESLKTSLDAVQQKLSQIRAQELQTQKDEIITLLENEIVGRYYYAYGKVKKSYQNDPEVAKAIELLLDPTKFNELLTVKSK